MQEASKLQTSLCHIEKSKSGSHFLIKVQTVCVHRMEEKASSLLSRQIFKFKNYVQDQPLQNFQVHRPTHNLSSIGQQLSMTC